MGFKAGDKIGGYEIVGELGIGGMGKVYRVKNLISERQEAMKILLPNLAMEAELAERFMREIRVHARLQHPNIAALNNAFEFENQLVMVMELVEGGSLQERLSHGSLSLEQTVDYGGQMLRALAYAHKQGVVHRDIKPGNMMVTPDGVVKLLDFGIAKASEDRKLTKTGLAVGSVYYMAPEQIQGTPPDPRSDLYSLGIVMYQFATGQRPIEGDSEFAIMSAHLKNVPVTPFARDSRIPPALSDVIMMALEKDPEKRFQSADAFLKALESLHLQTSPVQAPPVFPPLPDVMPPALPVKPGARNYRAAYMLAGAIAALLVVGFAVVQIPKHFGAQASGTAPVRTLPASSVQPSANQAMQTTPLQTQAPAVQLAAPLTVTRTQATGQSPGQSPAQSLAQSPAQQTTAPSQALPAVVVPVVVPPGQSAKTNQEAEKLQESIALLESLALQDSLALLEGRIAAADRSLDQLRQSQAKSGLSLRTDMASTQQLMRSFFEQAQNAVRAGDTAAATRHIKRAELNLEKLEKFLSGGR